jgi:membrane protein DedA with SNARE-associated domain
MAGAWPRRWAAAVLVAVVGALILVAILEGDLPEAVASGAHTVGHLLRRFGQLAAFGLLYLEESGVPMPMPGDVFVMYVGHRSARGLLTWLAAWLGLIAVVLLGASNLYWISRRWGRRFVEGPLGHFLHLTPGQLRRAETWFARWGMWTLVLGRHIPGLRVPLTVGAGVFRVRYRVFAASVAISTAIWAGFFMAIGAAVGGRVGHLLRLHREGYVIIPLLVALAFIAYLVLMIRRTRHAEVGQ